MIFIALLSKDHKSGIPDINKEITPMKKILVVIDKQSDFIDAALGTKEAQAIVKAVKEKILSYPIPPTTS